MVHDAAGIVRWMLHDAPGGLTPTPAMPGMGRLWWFATKVTSSDDDADVVARRRDRRRPIATTVRKTTN